MVPRLSIEIYRGLRTLSEETRIDVKRLDRNSNIKIGTTPSGDLWPFQACTLASRSGMGEPSRLQANARRQ
jgi:hypothetical protein